MEDLPHALVTAVLDELPLAVLFAIAHTSRLWVSLVKDIASARVTRVGPDDDLAALVEAAGAGATVLVHGTCRLQRRLLLSKPVRIVGDENDAALVGGGCRSMITISVGATVQVRDLALRYDPTDPVSPTSASSIISVLAGVLRLARCRLSWETASGFNSNGINHGVAARGGSRIEMDCCRIGEPDQAWPWIGPLLFCDRAVVTLSRCELKGAGLGGCVVLKGGTASLSRTDIGASQGNGVALWAAARATVSRCRLASCKDHGIAIMTQRGTLVAEANNTFDDISGERVFRHQQNSFAPPLVCTAASMGE